MADITNFEYGNLCRESERLEVLKRLYLKNGYVTSLEVEAVLDIIKENKENETV